MLRTLVASGARSEDDPRALLWRGFVEVVRALKPRAVLVENVPDLPAWNDGSVLINLHESLGDLGFEVEARVLNAFEYGVPQHRTRLILLGLRHGMEFAWPEPRAGRTTLYDAIGDLPPVPPAQRRDEIPYYGAETPFQRRMRRGVPPACRGIVYDHITRDIRPDDAEAFALLAEGDTYDDLPIELRRYRSDIFTDKYKRLEWRALSRSITAHIAKDGYWYIHPEQHRTLSIREAARVQTFPDWFRFAGHATLRLKQIGNAVPPMLAEAVGRQLVGALTSSIQARRASSTESFRTRLLEWHRRKRRPFIWRNGRHSPWHVLIGEICLTRTRRDLIPRMYRVLTAMAPDPRTLLRQPNVENELLELGLGARGELLLDIARTLVNEFGGLVPDDEMELRELPGVGDYAAQSILCFGFGRRAVLLDATTARVVTRHRAREDRRRWQLRLDLYQLAGARGPDAAFNRALLDLGAEICRAARPLCPECPLASDCLTRHFANASTEEPIHA
jgi:DNA (cytosine-5)-methyltransferase 1